MTDRGRRRLAWALAIVAIVMAAIGAVYAVASRHVPLPGQSFGPRGFATVLAIELAILGLVLATKRPGNPIGWLALAAGLGAGLQELADGYAIWAVAGHGSSTVLARLAAIGEDWIWLASFGLGALVLPLFPDGRPLSRRWGIWIAICAAGTAAAIVGYALSTHPLVFEGVSNPIGVPGASQVASVGVAFFLLLLVTGLASLVIRLRGSTGDEHEQMKWLAASTGLVVAMFVAYLLVYGIAGTQGALGNVLEAAIVLAIYTIPVSIGIAILKYRLYDIDVVIKKALIALMLAVLLGAVSLLVVATLGQVALWRGTPKGVSVLVGIVIGVAFVPVLRLSRRIADRVVYGRRATPYEVLSTFSSRVADTYSIDDVLPRLTQILAAATGATSARVLVRIGSDLQEVAAYGTPGGDEVSTPVVHQGEELGALVMAFPANDPIDPPKQTLITNMAQQAGLVLRNVRLVEELRASRQRIVAAQDARARKLERDIHDGAQQQLVALAVKQRLLTGLIGTDDERARAIADGLVSETNDALENLRDLARGIYPPLLADKGLSAALEAQARRAPVPVSVDAEGVDRYGQDVEAAVYFSCLEALQNVAKYANASSATIRLAQTNGHLEFEVTDDGAGFDTATTGLGSGLRGMADRLAAVGGEVTVRSSPSEGTTVAGRLPVGDAR